MDDRQGARRQYRTAARKTGAPAGAGASVDALSAHRAAASRGLGTRASSASRRRRGAGRRALTILAAVGTVLAVVLAVAATVRLSLANGRSYVPETRAAMQPVIEVNRRLTVSYAALSAPSGVRRATVSAHTAIGALKAAEQRLATLKRDSAGDAPFADRAQTAVGSELVWLQAALSVLADPHSRMLSRLGVLGAEAHARLAALDAQLPGAAASLPASTPVIAYARHKLAGAGTRIALTQFSAEVTALVEQSAPGHQELNDLFGTVQGTGAGRLSITLAQGEAVITTVVADRTSLATSARGLPAATPVAASVRGALAATLATGATDDQAIVNCLEQTTRGRFAPVLAGCLSATGSDTNAATSAEQRFLTLDNRLRRQLGQPPTTQAF